MSPIGTFRTCRDVRVESVMRSKAEVERHHDMDRAGNLLPCADRCCGVLGLTMAMCSPDVGLKWSCANVEARSERQTTRPAEIIQRAGAAGQLPGRDCRANRGKVRACWSTTAADRADKRLATDT